MTDLPARLRAVVNDMRAEIARVTKIRLEDDAPQTMPTLTVWSWVNDLDALLGALEAEQDRCHAERCVCGHFECAHSGATFRGVYTCEFCDCRGFQDASQIPAPPVTERREP